MDPDNVVHRPGKKPERVIIPEVVFSGERYFCNIIQIGEFIRIHTTIVKSLLIKRYIFIDVDKGIFQPACLEFSQPFSGHSLILALPVRTTHKDDLLLLSRFT